MYLILKVLNPQAREKIPGGYPGYSRPRICQERLNIAQAPQENDEIASLSLNSPTYFKKWFASRDRPRHLNPFHLQSAFFARQWPPNSAGILLNSHRLDHSMYPIFRCRKRMLYRNMRVYPQRPYVIHSAYLSTHSPCMWAWMDLMEAIPFDFATLATCVL